MPLVTWFLAWLACSSNIYVETTAAASLLVSERRATKAEADWWISDPFRTNALHQIAIRNGLLADDRPGWLLEKADIDIGRIEQTRQQIERCRARRMGLIP